MQTKTAIVLGAGMVGVSTALELQDRGWSVALVDRKSPGGETSFGNAGVIQSEAVEPYAMPRDALALIQIALRQRGDIRYSFSSLLPHAGVLLRYWWYSSPSLHSRISRHYSALISRAALAHDRLISKANAERLVRRDGYRVLYRSKVAFEVAQRSAERLKRTYGVNYDVLDAGALLRAEPALLHAGVGAIHWNEPYSIRDPGDLVSAYVELFRRRGGDVLLGDANTLRESRHGWSVESSAGLVEASVAVICLGPWSPELLRKFGVRVRMIAKRGYHRHFAGAGLLRAPLMDAENGYVLAPMACGMRITTGAHLAGQGVPTDLTQLSKAESAARSLIPIENPIGEEAWFGTRPCLPEMLPMIGRVVGYENLWVNIGHGHQGFTLGPITAEILVQAIEGEAPSINLEPFAVDRSGANILRRF